MWHIIINVLHKQNLLGLSFVREKKSEQFVCGLEALHFAKPPTKHLGKVGECVEVLSFFKILLVKIRVSYMLEHLIGSKIKKI